MAVSAKLYGNFVKHLLDKKIDFDTDTIKMALCTSSYSVDQDAHDFFDDITNEVSNSGTNYTSGGNTISNCSITYTGATNICKIDGDDVTFSAVTLTARYAIIYDSSPGTAGTNPLIAYIDFGADASPNGVDLIISFNSDGIGTFTVA
ncbi:MAG: hypothetical protein EHM20_00280 [Alphaproteobacteria bacterium]|nr:MAG: hypothetical protein EHM20_00280 [Alphaproteobacteria bacterium]